LRLRQVDALTAHEDNASELSDPDLLDRATSLGRVLFTHDDDLLLEAALRQKQETLFAGVIYVHQLQLTIGQIVLEVGRMGVTRATSRHAHICSHIQLELNGLEDSLA
jgi:translation initiation factor 6 (eIF-6)